MVNLVQFDPINWLIPYLWSHDAAPTVQAMWLNNIWKTHFSTFHIGQVVAPQDIYLTLGLAFVSFQLSLCLYKLYCHVSRFVFFNSVVKFGLYSCFLLLRLFSYSYISFLGYFSLFYLKEFFLFRFSYQQTSVSRSSPTRFRLRSVFQGRLHRRNSPAAVPGNLFKQNMKVNHPKHSQSKNR